MRGVLLLTAFAAVSAWSGAAQARNFRVSDIPNGSKFTCLTCHGELEAKTFTTFGTNARQNLEDSGPIQEAHVEWAGLCPLDSDGDGATNGQELGDPNCMWVKGQGNPAGSISNPGQADSSSSGECGNGHLNASEECDGAELSASNCLAIDAGVGELGCNADCTFDYSDCSKPPDSSGAGGAAEDDGGEDGCTVSAARDETRPDAATLGLLAAIAIGLRRRARASAPCPRAQRPAASGRGSRPT